MKTVKLSVLNRILVSGLLPAEGDFITLRVLRGFKAKIGFTEQEITEFQIRSAQTPDGKSVSTWNSQLAKDVDYELTEMEEKFIVDGLKELNKTKKLNEQHIELCEMFGIE